MRVAKLQMRIAMLAGVALAASSCQTAKKPAPLLPAKTAPALTATAAAAPPPSRQAQHATPPQAIPSKPAQLPPEPAAENKTQSTSPAPETDTVGELIARVEKQYQAGLEAFHSGQTARPRCRSLAPGKW